MEGQLLSWMYQRLVKSSSGIPRPDETFSDGLVALIFLYACLSDRSPRWACDKANWPLWARRVEFPSYSQLMKRIKAAPVAQLIETVDAELRGALPSGLDKVFDGKPLTVGGFSKDPDAKRGHVPRGWAKGYKLHVIVDETSGKIEAWDLTALNGGEPTTTLELLGKVDLKGATARGDSNYDSNPLYAGVAEAGGRLQAPRKKPFTELGHHENHPDRIRAIRHLELGDLVLEEHEHRRIAVEQALAHLTNLPFGLFSLPNFVRRLHRVKRWVAGKILLYHLYLNLSVTKAEAA
jgi:hypothetical protein